MQVVLERLDAQQAVEDVAPLVGREGLGVGAGLDRLAQPEPLAMAREVLDLVRDRPGVGLAQARQRVGERLARDEEVEGGRGDALERILLEAVVGRVERGIADRVAPERVANVRTGRPSQQFPLAQPRQRSAHSRA